MKKLLLSVLSLTVAVSAFTQNTYSSGQKNVITTTQRTCGITANEQMLQAQDPNRAAQRQQYETMVQQWIATHQNQITAQASITIPVVVHVVYQNAAENIPTNQVLSQIEVLNQDFTATNADVSGVPGVWTGLVGNIDVNFCMAQQDPSGNVTTGIDRVSTTDASFGTDNQVKFAAQGGANQWDPARYFNIWVCDLGGSLLGYGEFPTGSYTNTYGLVVGYYCFGSNYTSYGSGFTFAAGFDRGRTATHEIGHCFNLNHIWGDDGTGCAGTDNVADTPNQADENYGCPAFPNVSCSNGPNGDMFMNYMDYVDDACMFMFTNGQKARMLAVISSPSPYVTLTTSNACVLPSAAPPVALFAASSQAVCPSTPITFTNQTTVNATSWTWTFPSGTPSSSALQNPPTVTWTTPGTYTVTLVASNANGSSTYTQTITVLGIVNPPLTEGFEATTFVPANWSQNDAGNNGMIWERYNAGRNSSYSARFNNFANNVNGTRDDMRTPRMNFSSASTVSMTFDVSYRRYSTLAAESDTLEILYSTNCGATWTQVYIKGGATLATVTGTQTTAWVPSNTQWRNETVNLNATAGQGGVMIAFRNRGHYGNNIYVDNVNITTTTSALPNAAFTASATSVCRGTPVSFTDNSTNSPTAWTWTFPSGTPANATTQNVASVVWNTAGTYTVTHTATNANGTGTTTQTITVLPTPTVTATSSPTTAVCAGTNVTLTGGGATTYNWMPGAIAGSPITVAPTTTTTYTVTGTAANGCTSTGTRTITVNALPTVTATSTVSTICSGSNVTLTGGGASTYNWMPGNINTANATVSPTVTTTYTLTGTAANGCTNTATRTITVNPTPTITTTTSSATICSGSSTTITANGATTYTWMPGNLTGTTVTVTPTGTTTYTVTGTSSGCTATATRIITVNPTPTVTTTTSGGTICAGSSTTLTGNGAATYNWMPGNLNGSPVTVSPTTTTTYTLTGTAANGCTATATRTITVNPAPNVTASSATTTICSGGSTTLNATGANTYVWMPGNLTGASPVVSPTTTTTYTVTGTTTATGCTATQTVMITVNPTPTVTTTATSTTICSGSSTTITANGATTYAWMPGNLTGTSVTVSPTTTTTYTVTGSNGGCNSTATRTITVNTSPTVNTTTSGATICSGNSTTITGTGASTYAWTPGPLSGTTVTVSPATTTTYTVTGTAANGCTGTATRTITVNQTPTVTVTATNSTICSGSSTTLNANGATTYTWMPGNLTGTSVTVSPSTTTTYTVTGTSTGCSSTATRTITVNTSPTVGTTTSGATICSGSSTTITGTGASTYGWMPGNLTGSPVTVSPTTTTTYTVTGTAANGCTGTATRTITVNTSPSVTASASSASICVGNNVTLTSSGASTYNWMPGNLNGVSVTATPPSTTTYTVTGTAGNGCTGTQTVMVTVGPLPTITSSSSVPAICDGDNATLNANGGSSYTWMPGNLSGSSVTVNPTATTTYTVTGTSGPGCSNTSTVTLTVNALPAVTANTSANAVCDGNAVTLFGSGASSYAWSSSVTDNVAFTPIVTDTYTVTGTDANGCSNTATVSVTVNALPSVTANTTAGAVCDGDAITLSGSGAAAYTWSGSVTDNVPFTPIVTDTYTVTGTDANGCSNTATVSVTVNTLPSVSASTSATDICEGSSVTLSGNGANNYDWMPGSLNGASVTDVPTASTTYTVTGTDANGCSNTATVGVNVNALPSVSASTSATDICEGSSVTLTANGANNYDWMPGSLSGASVTDAPTTSTTYTVTGTDANGCSNTSTVTVTVNAGPVVSIALALDTFCDIDGATPLMGGSPAGGNYSGPGVSGNAFDPSSVGAGTFAITYTFVDANGCTDSASQNVVVDFCLGVATQNNGPSINAMPNPNNGNFVLSFSAASSADYVIEIHNALGQVVFTEQLTNFTGVYRKDISIAEYGTGLYTVRLRTADSESVIRVITQ